MHNRSEEMMGQSERLVVLSKHPSVPLHNIATDQSQRGPLIGRGSTH